MSAANSDADRNPVSPVVTSPDARTQPDESRPVTSQAMPSRVRMLWGELIGMTPSQIEESLYEHPAVDLYDEAKLLLGWAEMIRTTAQNARINNTGEHHDGGAPPPAR